MNQELISIIVPVYNVENICASVKIVILASLNCDLTNHILIYKNRLQRVIAKLEEQNIQFTEIYGRMMEKLSLLP